MTFSRRARRLGPAIALALILSQFTTTIGGATTPAGANPPTPESSKDADVIPGQLVVRFRTGVSADDRQSVLVTAGATDTRNAVGLDATLAKVDPADALSIQKELEGDPRVMYAEPNYRVEATDDTRMPNDPDFSNQWGLNNTGQYAGDGVGVPDADIDAPEAWRVTTGSPDVVVAVIDTGIDFSNPDLGGSQQDNPRMWINPGEDCSGCRIDGVDNDGNGYIDDWHGWDFINDDNNPFDDNGHGTHVSGIIGATGDNGIGGTGVAWNVSLVGLKFLDFSGGGSTFDAAEAIVYAANMGFPITNNSWGGAVGAQVLIDAIQTANQAGTLVVVAAGNDAYDSDDIPSYPASYDAPNIITVAATDNTDNLAYFSNFGSRSVDLGAPGQDIYSTWTGVAGLPFTWLSGTSMATPMVSGAAALVRSRFPDADALAIKTLLMSTVDKTPALKGKVVSNGRLNVDRAVRCQDQPVLLVEQPQAGFAVEGGTAVAVSAYAGDCADIDGVVVAASVNGTPIQMTVNGDGTYAGTFTAGETGPLSVSVSAAVENRRITTNVQGAVVENYQIRNVPYEWIEPRATGGYQILMWDDDGSSVVDLPFTFNYYGTGYDHLTVSTNGYVVFGDSPATSFGNEQLPDESRPNGVVAPFWDDLNPSAAGSIWWDVEGDAPNRRYVVAWELVPHYDNVGASSFEVIFDEATSAITFQYQNVLFGDPTIDYGASATVGIEHPAGTVGRTFSNNTASLERYQQHFGIQFVEAAPGAPSILDFSLPQATVATDYSYTVQHTGGVDPVSWSIADGDLPPGLSLDPATGEIAGSPTEAGNFEFTLQLTDSSTPAQTAEQLLDLEVVIGYQMSEVPFTWIDARDGGTDAGFTLDDSSIGVELPFVFGFYDGEFTDLKISSNGYIVFGDSAANFFSNANIPDANDPNGYAAAFWDDLSPQDGGGVWYRTVGDAPNRKFVIAWYDTPRYKLNGAATFEIVLEEGTNAIEFQYLDTSFEFSVYDFGAAATIGLENLTGSSGTLFSYDEARLQPYDGVTGLRFSVLTFGELPPFITSIPVVSAKPGEPYTYQPSAHGADPLVWSLLSGPDGMTVDPDSGEVNWTPTDPGDYPVSLQVTDANGSDEQDFVISVAAGEVHTETWGVVDGWLAPPGQLLSDLGQLELVQSSDDQRLELLAGAWASFKFDGSIPDGATIESISIVVEYYESAGTTGDPLTWEVGGGPLDAPLTLASMQPEQVLGAPSEKAIAWDIGQWITDPAAAGDLTFVVRNPSSDGTVYLDQVSVDVVYLVP